jgi:uncharacterized protein (TIGR03435 family)
MFYRFTAAFALLTLSALAAQAQELAGQWQGTMKQGDKALRLLFKIEQADNGLLRGQMFNIDQGPQPYAINPVDQDGNSIEFTIPALDASYKGKFATDGSRIVGNFQQGSAIYAMVILRATSETTWAIPVAAAPKPMSILAETAFASVIVKPSDPAVQGRSIGIRGGQFTTVNSNLNSLIEYAYGVHRRQIVNGPEWMDSIKFDLMGKPAGDGAPSAAQWKRMVAKLLADRFQLTFHREKRELPVYALVAATGGPKLTTTAAAATDLSTIGFRGLGSLPARNASIADLAGVLQSAVLDRPVLDRSGLTGRYDFTLNWTPDSTQFSGLGIQVPPPADPASAPPGLARALEQQLGLKLDSTQAGIEVLVVDKIVKPSEN